MLRNDPLMQNDGCSHPDRRNRRIPTSCEFDSLEVFRPLSVLCLVTGRTRSCPLSSTAFNTRAALALGVCMWALLWPSS